MLFTLMKQGPIKNAWCNFAGKSENYNPPSKLEVDLVFRDLNSWKRTEPKNKTSNREKSKLSVNKI